MTLSCSCLALALALALFVAVLSHAQCAMVAPLHDACVLYDNGTTACTPPDLPQTVRPRGRSRPGRASNRSDPPCKKSDIKCWNKLIRRYTNEVRAKNNVKTMLKLGPKRQLLNAARHAEYLGKMGKLKHQILTKATRQVRCKRWIGGENLAYNYETGDIARTCVNQWINSLPHKKNLLRDWFEEVVTGFFFGRDGRVYCVQTFGLKYPRGTFGSPNADDCAPVA